MKSRFLLGVFRAGCWALFVVAVVWPSAALLTRCITQGQPPQGGFVISARQLGLLWRSVWLAGTATGIILIMALPVAYVLGTGRGMAARPVTSALLLLVLLTPPMVTAFGWEHLLVPTFNPYARCIGVWALWLWPIPAALVGVAWSRTGRSSGDAALLSTSGVSSFFRVRLPQVRRYLGVAAMLVFLLCFRDYGVPHACGLLVYSTELLGWARDSIHPIDTVWPSLPSVAVTVGALAWVMGAWRRSSERAPADTAGDRSEPVVPRRHDKLTWLVVVCVALSWMVPIGGLIVKLGSVDALRRAAETYGPDVVWSTALAGACGVIVVAMGLGLAGRSRWGFVALVWAVVFGALPGALVGEALVAAFNLPRLWWLYDTWPILAICFLARFAWIGIVAARATTMGTSALIDQARTDGASLSQRLVRIHLPLNLPVLLCCVAIVMALSLAEVPASSLVRVPQFSLVSHILIEKFHRFEYGMLLSLSLWLVAAAALPAVLLVIAVRRTRSV